MPAVLRRLYTNMGFPCWETNRNFKIATVEHLLRLTAIPGRGTLLLTQRVVYLPRVTLFSVRTYRGDKEQI